MEWKRWGRGKEERKQERNEGAAEKVGKKWKN